MKSLLVSICGAVVALAFAGCSRQPDYGEVQGRVTMGDQPVTDATITFENQASGVAVMAPLGADGGYQVKTHEADGLPPGAYRVTVTPGAIMTDTTNIPLAGQEPPSQQPPATPIPEKYRTAAASPLQAEVKAGENAPFNFDLSP